MYEPITYSLYIYSMKVSKKTYKICALSGDYRSVGLSYRKVHNERVSLHLESPAASLAVGNMCGACAKHPDHLCLSC